MLSTSDQERGAVLLRNRLTADGPLRFSLERAEGASHKSLTASLHGLERDGLIRRSVTVQVPTRVAYEASGTRKPMVITSTKAMILIILSLIILSLIIFSLKAALIARYPFAAAARSP